MRFWNRLANPNQTTVRTRSTETRARSLIHSSLGQRPLFSRPDDPEVTRSLGILPSDIDLDGVTPTDRSPGNSEDEVSQAEVEDVIAKRRQGALSNPPTSAQLDDLLGLNSKVNGFVGIAKDGALLAYLVVSDGSDWYFEALTRAT